MEPTRVNSVNSVDEAVKADEGKVRLDLLPVAPLWYVAKVYTYGAKKYAPDNWRKGMSWSRIYAALLRHLFRFWNGEDIDPESGLPHLAHAAFGVLTLLEYRRSHLGDDDRVTGTEKI